MGAVPNSVPTAVAPSIANSVRVDLEAQLKPYQPMSGSARIPVVPRSDELNDKNVNQQPSYGTAIDNGSPRGSGNPGAPSVPAVGLIYQAPPLDSHYSSEYEDYNPYYKVNNPPTRGMWTRTQDFLNHVFNGKQNVNEAGWQQNSPQQRTSVMRNALPPHGIGYAPEGTGQPVQLPQRDNTYKYNPSVGTDPYGSGVLNSNTFGAGQTYGGQGGNNYTPTPGPPPTNSTAGNNYATSGMPTWG